jgi:hypothetical protein
LNITHTVVQTADIATLGQTQNTIQQTDTELQQLDNLENTIPNIRNRYQDNINKLNILLPLQKLQESLERLNFTP